MTKIVLRWVLVKTYLQDIWNHHFICFMGYENFPFRISRKFIGSCSMDVNQSLKYFKKTFRSHENRRSWTLENGRSDSLRSNLWEFMSLIFIISKNISIKEQNFAVQVDSGVTYFNKALLAMELNICAASLTFVMEYGVSLICCRHNFGSIWSPHSWSL